MKKNKIEGYRNKDGFINLNKLESFCEKGEVVEGSNAKTWYNVDGVRFLYKEYNSVLPAFGEVLYYKVASNCGIECAKYDFAQLRNKIGTISYDFLGKNETYYNFLELTSQFMDTKFTLEEIKKTKDLLVVHNNKYNNLNSIKKLLVDLFESVDEKEIEISLIKRFVLDAVFLHRDRNLWNYGVVVDEENDKMKLVPCHDNSHVLYLEKGEKYIEELISYLINGGKLDDYLGCSSFNLEDSSGNSIEQLLNYYEESDLGVRKEIEDLLKKINVDKEIEYLKSKIKIGDIPLLWIKTILNFRKMTILKGIESAKIVSEVASKPNVTFSKRK